MINLKITIQLQMLQTCCNNITKTNRIKNKYNIFNKYNGRYLGRCGVRVVMPRDRVHTCDERHNRQKNRLISGVGLDLQ
jgi:hypothetical protein